MERKLDRIKGYIKHVTDRNDIVYINQLETLKRRLVDEERYEEAKKVKQCIDDELKRLNKDKQ